VGPCRQSANLGGERGRVSGPRQQVRLVQPEPIADAAEYRHRADRDVRVTEQQAQQATGVATGPGNRDAVRHKDAPHIDSAPKLCS
jgi:hypothetical protein